jgi:glutamine synthetase
MNAPFVLFGVPDVHGLFRAKLYPAARFATLVESDGFRISSLVLALDPADQPISTLEGIGLTVGAGDLHLRPDLTTMRDLQTPVRWQLCLGDLLDTEGIASCLAPRAVLQGVLARRTEPTVVRAAFEYEFRLSDVGRDERPRTYAALSLASVNQFLERFAAALEDASIELVGLHTEPAVGLFEVNVAAGDVLRAADDAFFLRLIARLAARSCGYQASFLAKPAAEEEGSGGHLHLSVWAVDQTNTFHNLADHRRPSDRLRHAVGGLLALMPSFAAIYNP